MKKCPNCNRQYSDESLNFCLDDGTVLIADSDNITDENIERPTEQQTEILSYEGATEAFNTEQKTSEISNEKDTVLNSQPFVNNSQPQIVKQGVSPLFAYLSVGLLALLILFVGVGIAFWISSNSKDASNSAIAQNNSDAIQSNLAIKGNKTVNDLTTNKKSIPPKTPKKNTKETPEKDKNENVKPTPEASETASPKPTATPKPTELPKPEKNRYFVILGSFPQTQKAKARKHLQLAKSKGLSARIVNTNDVPGLRSGLLAIVLGPFSKSVAQSQLQRAKSISLDAYVKAG